MGNDDRTKCAMPEIDCFSTIRDNIIRTFN
jgi:hypothetical protein